MRSGTFYADDLAYVHHAGFTEYVRCAAPGVLQLLRGSGIREGTVVDLGCGSGVLLARLGQAGYRTMGVDVSPAFLRLARIHAPHARLLHGSAHTVPLPPCRAVTAIGEVLAYQSPGSGAEKGLQGVFERVHASLDTGGLFAFDLFVASAGAPYALRSWRAGEDWAVHSESHEDRAAQRVHRHVTTFRRVGDTYRRSQEHHVLRVYDPHAVRRELREVGFQVRTSRSYGSFEVPERRLVFVARKG